MIRRPPRSTLDRSSAASDVYKRQDTQLLRPQSQLRNREQVFDLRRQEAEAIDHLYPVSYTHLRAHETVLDLVCRLLLAKKQKTLLYRDAILNISSNIKKNLHAHTTILNT